MTRTQRSHWEHVKNAAGIHIVAAAMDKHNGNITLAAAELGCARRTIRDTLKMGGMHPWGIRANYCPPPIDWPAFVDAAFGPQPSDHEGQEGRGDKGV